MASRRCFVDGVEINDVLSIDFRETFFRSFFRLGPVKVVHLAWHKKKPRLRTVRGHKLEIGRNGSGGLNR